MAVEGSKGMLSVLAASEGVEGSKGMLSVLTAIETIESSKGMLAVLIDDNFAGIINNSRRRQMTFVN
jgi:hypothetical protein